MQTSDVFGLMSLVPGFSSMVESQSEIIDTRRAIIDERVSLQDVADEFFRRISSDGQDKFRAWESLSHEALSRSVQQVEDRWRRRGPAELPLLGALVGVKDVFCTEDFPTRMGSRAWHDRGQFDARVVRTARDFGALIAGKTKTAEFAVHDPPDTLNPTHVGFSVGTSSSGSAVAVARGHVPVALATQQRRSQGG